MQGYIKLHREIQQHPIWVGERFSRGQAWVDLLLSAQHAGRSFRVRGNLVTLSRGQVGHSKSYLAGRWKWDRKTVQRFLDDLQDDGMITQQKSKVVTVVTIINYGTWQDRQIDETAGGGQQNPQQDGQQKGQQNPQQAPQQKGHKQEGEEREEGKEREEQQETSSSTDVDGVDDNSKPKKRKKHSYPPAFDKWLWVYPRRVGKLAALKAWERALVRIQAEHDVDRYEAIERLNQAAYEFAMSAAGKKGTGTPHPASWLNAGRWDDDRADWGLTDDPGAQPDALDFTAADFEGEK